MTLFADAPWRHWPQTQQLVAAFAPHPQAIRFVGGAVRDTLLGRVVQDVDVATTLLPEATMEVLQKAGIHAIPTGIQHGTVTAVIDGKHFEITTLRKDIACDGRRADVVFTDSWQEDASRRDFTMNAMYLSPESELFDYFGGQEDAKAGHVRFIGDAATRISEDYLRILRFFRFYAHYGASAPDYEAVTACAANVAHLASLSGERVQHELLRIWSAPVPSSALARMHGQAMWPYLLGFNIKDADIFFRFEEIARAMFLSFAPEVMWSGFIISADIPKEQALEAISSRLKLSRAHQDAIGTMLLYKDEISPFMLETRQKRLLRKLGTQDYTNAVVLAWADSDELIAGNHEYAQMLDLSARWEPPLFPVTGGDLLAHGLPAGKGIGDILRRMEEMWEATDYQFTKEDLLKTAG